MGLHNISPVDNVPPGLDQNASQNRVWNIRRQRCQDYDNSQQEQAVQHAGDFCGSSGSDVDHRSHGGASARNASEQASHHVADPLTDQLAVGVVPGTGHIVRNQRGKQAVDRAKQGQYQRRFEHNQDGVLIEARHDKTGQPGGNISQDRRAGQEQTGKCANDQSRQRWWHDFGQSRRPFERDQQREHAQNKRGKVRISHGAGNFHQRRNGPAAFRFMPEQAGGLQGNDDAADAAHESGNHRIGDQTDILTQLENTEGNLNGAGKHHCGENQ